MAYANVPADLVPLVEPGIEPMSVPEEPGIADPLPIRTIEPNTKSGSSKTINPNTNSRPRVPMKAIEPTQITAPKQITAPEREFPTSTQQGSEVPFNVRPKQPAIELRPLETASNEFNESCQTIREALPRESRFVANISHQHYLVTSDREGNFEVEQVDTV